MKIIINKLLKANFQYFIIIFIILLLPTFFLNKECLNLKLNFLHSPFLDFFFKNVTHFGDGLIYLPIIILTFFFSKKNTVCILVLFIIQTSISMLFKEVLMRYNERPALYLKNTFHLLHKVDGVTIHNYSTFPSGHTTTAFAIAFFIFFNFSISNKLKYFLFILATFVALSRVYLLQHFYIDVLFGYFFGYFAAFLTPLAIENNKQLKKFYV